MAGYTVTSVVSSRQGWVYVAGAPRFNHTGKAILFTMHNNRSLTIHQALRGEQVMKGESGGRGAVGGAYGKGWAAEDSGAQQCLLSHPSQLWGRREAYPSFLPALELDCPFPRKPGPGPCCSKGSLGEFACPVSWTSCLSPLTASISVFN